MKRSMPRGYHVFIGFLGGRGAQDEGERYQARPERIRRHIEEGLHRYHNLHQSIARKQMQEEEIIACSSTDD